MIDEAAVGGKQRMQSGVFEIIDYTNASHWEKCVARCVHLFDVLMFSLIKNKINKVTRPSIVTIISCQIPFQCITLDSISVCRFTADIERLIRDWGLSLASTMPPVLA